MGPVRLRTHGYRLRSRIDLNQVWILDLAGHERLLFGERDLLSLGCLQVSHPDLNIVLDSSGKLILSDQLLWRAVVQFHISRAGLNLNLDCFLRKDYLRDLLMGCSRVIVIGLVTWRIG